MLIFNQSRDMLLNMGPEILVVQTKGNTVVAIEGYPTREFVLGEYSSSDAAKQVLAELANEYGKYYRVDGGPMATVNAFVQPLMFEPPKVYKMPEYR